MINSSDYFIKFQWSHLFDEIKKFSLQYIKDESSFGNHTVVAWPELPDSIVALLPIRPDLLQVFRVRPNVAGGIHKDGVGRLCALNVPLSGSDGSIFQWYADSPEIVENFIPTAPARRLAIYSEHGLPMPIVETQTELPTLVNNNSWHRVNNVANSEFRWTASVRFNGNPTFANVNAALLKMGQTPQ